MGRFHKHFLNDPLSAISQSYLDCENEAISARKYPGLIMLRHAREGIQQTPYRRAIILMDCRFRGNDGLYFFMKNA